MTALGLWLRHVRRVDAAGLRPWLSRHVCLRDRRGAPFQAEQAAAFEQQTRAQTRGAVKQGGLVGMLDVPRLQLSTPVIEGDDTGT